MLYFNGLLLAVIALLFSCHVRSHSNEPLRSYKRGLGDNGNDIYYIGPNGAGDKCLQQDPCQLAKVIEIAPDAASIMALGGNYQFSEQLVWPEKKTAILIKSLNGNASFTGFNIKMNRSPGLSLDGISLNGASISGDIGSLSFMNVQVIDSASLIQIIALEDLIIRHSTIQNSPLQTNSLRVEIQNSAITDSILTLTSLGDIDMNGIVLSGKNLNDPMIQLTALSNRETVWNFENITGDSIQGGLFSFTDSDSTQIRTIKISSSKFSNLFAYSNGGFLSSQMSNVVISINHVSIVSSTCFSSGGAIYIMAPNVHFTMSNSDITTASAEKNGGCLDLELSGTSSVSLLQSIITECTAKGLGGGIYASVESLDLESGTITTSTANAGAGAAVSVSSVLNVGSNFLIEKNSAALAGGGILFLSGSEKQEISQDQVKYNDVQSESLNPNFASVDIDKFVIDGLVPVPIVLYYPSAESDYYPVIRGYATDWFGNRVTKSRQELSEEIYNSLQLIPTKNQLKFRSPPQIQVDDQGFTLSPLIFLAKSPGLTGLNISSSHLSTPDHIPLEVVDCGNGRIFTQEGNYLYCGFGKPSPKNPQKPKFPPALRYVIVSLLFLVGLTCFGSIIAIGVFLHYRNEDNGVKYIVLGQEKQGLA